MPQAGLRRRQGPVTQRNESEPSDSLLEHPQESLWGFGGRVLRLGLLVSFLGRASAMARIASDSAVSRAFAAADLTSVYQRANGVTSPGSPASSVVAIDSIFLSPDRRRKSAASRRSPLPLIASRATRRSESRSPLGPASIKGSQPSRRSFFPAAVTL